MARMAAPPRPMAPIDPRHPTAPVTAPRRPRDFLRPGAEAGVRPRAESGVDLARSFDGGGTAPGDERGFPFSFEGAGVDFGDLDFALAGPEREPGPPPRTGLGDGVVIRA